MFGKKTGAPSNRGATISATNHIGHIRGDDIGHSNKTISATRKINIGHNHIGVLNHIGHKIYSEFIWRHRVDTSLFRVVRILNFNVKPCIRR